MIDKETLDWMLKQSDHELVTVLFGAGRITDLAYWRQLMPLLRCARAEGAAPDFVKAMHGLDRAAYALFQLKRFVDMPQAAIDFVREEHGKACAIYDSLPSVASPLARPQEEKS